MAILFSVIFVLGILWLAEKILFALFGIKRRMPVEDKNKTSSWRRK